MLNYDLYEILRVYKIGFISFVKCTVCTACKILLVLSTYFPNIQNTVLCSCECFSTTAKIWNEAEKSIRFIQEIIIESTYWAWICTKSMYLSLQSVQFMPNKQILIGHAKTNYKARIHKELWFHRHNRIRANWLFSWPIL